MNLFKGGFLGIGIKTVRYRYLNETYYLYSSSDHVFFLATGGTLMLPKTGTLQIADHAFKLTKKAILDIKERIAHSQKRLNLPETVDQLYNLFIDNKIIEAHIMSGIERDKRRKQKNNLIFSNNVSYLS